MSRIAIVVGSTRPGRLGIKVGQWVAEQAQGREGASYELVDLADFNLPILDEPVPAAAGIYQHEHTKKWSEAIGQYDGFIFVTAEYNHGVPGAFKNAFDFLFKEWNNKALGLVSYGAAEGHRAVEQWRAIAANAHLFDVRSQVSVSIFTEFTDGEFTPNERRAEEAAAVFDEVEKLSAALAPLRG